MQNIRQFILDRNVKCFDVFGGPILDEWKPECLSSPVSATGVLECLDWLTISSDTKQSRILFSDFRVCMEKDFRPLTGVSLGRLRTHVEG